MPHQKGKKARCLTRRKEQIAESNEQRKTGEISVGCQTRRRDAGGV
ncbi:MAG: hypothetical protein LBL06_04105 [Treponema sp.]|nr:hypothetical protein [Treponema sp.]